jgi:hypothetical protein
MFTFFNRTNPEDEMKRAKAAFEKVAELKSDSREARSARMRMGLLCCAYLDKTFIAGAEQTASWQDATMMALSQGKTPPEPPEATTYQKIKSGEAEVYVYLPIDYSQEAFLLGAKYQKTEISAEKAIELMQALANQVSYYELKLDEPFQVLRFLRDEIEAAQNPDETASEKAVQANTN